MGFLEYWDTKIQWGLCDLGYAWWIQELQGCQIINGICYGFYGGGEMDCENEGEDDWWPDPWEDMWWWCSEKVNKVAGVTS